MLAIQNGGFIHEMNHIWINFNLGVNWVNRTLNSGSWDFQITSTLRQTQATVESQNLCTETTMGESTILIVKYTSQGFLNIKKDYRIIFCNKFVIFNYDNAFFHSVYAATQTKLNPHKFWFSKNSWNGSLHKINSLITKKWCQWKVNTCTLL